MIAATAESPGAAQASDRLTIELIRRRLASESVGRHIYLFGRVASTGEVLRRLADAGAREGTVVVSDDEPGLRVSALCRLADPLHALPALAFGVARALGEALRAAGSPTAVGAECATAAHGGAWAILGVAVNFGGAPGGPPRHFDRNAFVAGFLDALARLLAAYTAGGPAAVLAPAGAGRRTDAGE